MKDNNTQAKSKRTRIYCKAALATAAGLLTAFAGNIAKAGAAEEPVPQMDTVVVTATRMPQPQSTVPAEVTVIDRQQIQESGATSVPALLSSVPGVVVTDLNGNGVNQTVDIGGFGETATQHVAVLIDGRRINPIDLAGIQWSTIPVNNIERIEILRGGGSVLYGDNAMGGVINIITREPEAGFSSSLAASRGSYDGFNVDGGVNGGWDTGAVRFDFNSFTTDGYRDRSASDRQSVSGKLWLYPLPSTSFTLSVDSASAQYQLPGALTLAQMEADRRQAVFLHDKGSNEEQTVALGIRHEAGSFGVFSLDVSKNEEDTDSDFVTWFSYATYDKDTVGILPHYSLEHRLGGMKANLLAGVDYYDTDYTSQSGAFKGADTNHYDIEKKSIAGYLQEEVEIGRALSLNLGARYEEPEYDITARADDSMAALDRRDGEWAANGGLAWRPVSGTKIWGRLYRAFRYPLVDEIIVNNFYTGEVTINPDLHQETSLGYEAGIQYAYGNTASIDLRLYRQKVSDEILFNFNSFQNENISETRHQGAELAVRYQIIEGISLYGGLSYTDAEFSTGPNDGKKLPLVPEWKGDAGLEFKCPYGISSRIQVNYVDERYAGGDNANIMPRLDNHTTVDIYFAYKYKKKIEFFVNGNNIFGEKYVDSAYSGSYYPMPEDTWFGGVRLLFP